METLLLSRNRYLYSTRRLQEAARKRGFSPAVLDPLRLSLLLVGGQAQIFHNRKPFPLPDVVIPRIGASITDYGLAVLTHFGLAGVPALNGPQAIAVARDKLRALQVLTEQGIGVPETVMVRSPRDLRVALEAIGGVPAILKLLQGTQGIGVMIVDSVQAAESVLDAFWSLGQNILLQKYYPIAREEGDLRAFVVGGEVVALMRRKTASGEFRSNIHRGAVGIPVLRPDPEVLRVARAATAAVGLEVAGVDVLESPDGPIVLELNPTPGLEGIEKATGQDIAVRVLDRAESLALRVRV